MCSAIDVTELQVPFAIEKSSIEITRNYEEGAPQQGEGEADHASLGISFKYRSTDRVALQMYWHVQVNALSTIIANCNYLHGGSLGGNVTTEGRKRKRLFGRGYISVNQATDANRNSFEMQLQQQRLPGEPLTTRSQSTPLFTDAQACARSPTQQLAAHPEEWVQAESVPQCRILASAVERCPCHTPSSAGAAAAAGAAATAPSAPATADSPVPDEIPADIEGGVSFGAIARLVT